ncbi:DUF4747 family protein [Alcaligenes nematophilus]|uniref:DUF4747 family protein n=1 Tax=Alcaligenes nematophilus TaxID=2994643 RepID=UPI003D1F0C0E
MSRKTQATVCELNIRVHPEHKPSEYIALWKILFNLRWHFVRGHTGLMIGESKLINEDSDEPLIRGYLYKFLEIDLDLPWFNTERGKKAGEEDLERISIPEELRPNLVEIPYVFNVKNHRLHFVSKSGKIAVSPMMVRNLIKDLSTAEAVQDRFPGGVDVSIATDKKDIDRLLNIHSLRSLTITIERPNPRESEDDATVYERMRRRGISKEIREYKKASNESSIHPDDEMFNLAHIAAENGKVEVSGRDASNRPIKASSNEFPKRKYFSYQKSMQTILDALQSFVA